MMYGINNNTGNVYRQDENYANSFFRDNQAKTSPQQKNTETAMKLMAMFGAG